MHDLLLPMTSRSTLYCLAPGVTGSPVVSQALLFPHADRLLPPLIPQPCFLQGMVAHNKPTAGSLTHLHILLASQLRPPTTKPHARSIALQSLTSSSCRCLVPIPLCVLVVAVVVITRMVVNGVMHAAVHVPVRKLLGGSG
jgi:hypothetical protein